jgi:hypothetical protein
MIDAARAWASRVGASQIHLYALEDNAGVESSYIGETPVVDRRYVIASFQSLR